jgi:uncharacterized protein
MSTPIPYGQDVPPGVPNRVTLRTADHESAADFYTGLFGWTAQASPRPEDGGFLLFKAGAQVVAGALPEPFGSASATWLTYIATDDVERLTQRVEAAGGTTVGDPHDRAGRARVGVFLDPAGAVFAGWQTDPISEAAVLDPPVSLDWNELRTPDPEAAGQFYEAVFGWAPGDETTESRSYTMWRLGSWLIGGMTPVPARDRGGPDPQWVVCFAVEDADAVLTRATELGGSVAAPPTDLPPGRIVSLTDPQGAAFSVIQLGPV